MLVRPVIFWEAACASAIDRCPTCRYGTHVLTAHAANAGSWPVSEVCARLVEVRLPGYSGLDLLTRPVCRGRIHSSTMLMHSGVGAAEQPRQRGIAVIVDPRLTGASSPRSAVAHICQARCRTAVP